MEWNQIKSNGWPNGRDILSDFISLFFPDYCIGCNRGLVKGETTLCTHCIRELPKTGYSFLANNSLTERFTGRLPINRATALFKFRKSGVAQKLLHQLKYQNSPEIGVKLGRLLGLEMKEGGLFEDLDLIVPVPLHPSRRRQRGFNQSTMFAQGIGEVLNLSWTEDLLVRLVNTKTQTRKTKLARWQNVKDVFAIKKESNILNKNVLLVDDVITTGATLEACGKSLIEAGCKSLSVACIAEA